MVHEKENLVKSFLGAPRKRGPESFFMFSGCFLSVLSGLVYERLLQAHAGEEGDRRWAG